MGGGVFKDIPEEESFKGFLKIKTTYDQLKAQGKADEIILDEVKLILASFSQNEAVRRALGLSPEELEEEAEKVLVAFQTREKQRGGPAGGTPEADYSKGFSGTKKDTQVEKEFESLVRGGGAAEEETNPLLIPVECSIEEHKALRKAGKWMKFLGASGCYMYCHSLTHEMVSVQPEDYEDNGEGEKKEEEDPACGLPSCELTELPAVLQSCLEEDNKTPLFIDNSGEGKVAAFFSYKHSLVDVSVLSVGFAKSGVKVADLAEKVRQKLVLALKSGSTLAVNFGSVTAAHGNFKKKICKKDGFPAETFQQGGKKLYAPKNKPRYQAIFREEDMEGGAFLVREGFRFVAISTLTPAEYKEALQETLPLGYMRVIYVRC